MKKSQGNSMLYIIVIVLVILLILAVGTAAYFWGRSRNGSQETSITKSSAEVTQTQTNQSQLTPKKVVENFMNYSIGTIPTSSLNFNSARSYLSNDLRVEFSDDASFAARYYGYQDGPTSVEIISESIKGDDASVKVNAFWKELGQGWVFSLLKTNGRWQIVDFKNDAQ